MISRTHKTFEGSDGRARSMQARFQLGWFKENFRGQKFIKNMEYNILNEAS